MSDYYLFHAFEHDDEYLWRIVRDYRQYSRDGCIGDCVLRTEAQRERATTASLNMVSVAFRAALELLDRHHGEELKDAQVGQ